MLPPSIARMPVRRVTATLISTAPWTAPAHPGDTLRRALVSGIYGAVPREHHRALLGGWFDVRRGSDRIRPYALDVDLPEVLEAGDTVRMELTLVGAIPEPSVLIHGLRAMAHKGLGDSRVPHELVRVHVQGAETVDVDLDDGAGFPAPVALGAVADVPVEPPAGVQVRFSAPYTDPTWRPPGRPEVLGVSPDMLFQAGLLRLRGLERAVGHRTSGPLRVPDAHAIESQLQWFEVDVQSRRKRRPDRLHGALGSVTFVGDLAGLVPLLVMGEVVQLGRSTSRGHGRIEVAWLS